MTLPHYSPPPRYKGPRLSVWLSVRLILNGTAQNSLTRKRLMQNYVSATLESLLGNSSESGYRIPQRAAKVRAVTVRIRV